MPFDASRSAAVSLAGGAQRSLPGREHAHRRSARSPRAYPDRSSPCRRCARRPCARECAPGSRARSSTAVRGREGVGVVEQAREPRGARGPDLVQQTPACGAGGRPSRTSSRARRGPRRRERRACRDPACRPEAGGAAPRPRHDGCSPRATPCFTLALRSVTLSCDGSRGCVRSHARHSAGWAAALGADLPGDRWPRRPSRESWHERIGDSPTCRRDQQDHGEGDPLAGSHCSATTLAPRSSQHPEREFSVTPDETEVFAVVRDQRCADPARAERDHNVIE